MLLNKSFNLCLPDRETKGSQRGYDDVNIIPNIWMKSEKCFHILYVWKTSVYLHNLFGFTQMLVMLTQKHMYKS